MIGIYGHIVAHKLIHNEKYQVLPPLMCKE